MLLQTGEGHHTLYSERLLLRGCHAGSLHTICARTWPKHRKLRPSMDLRAHHVFPPNLACIAGCGNAHAFHVLPPVWASRLVTSYQDNQEACWRDAMTATLSADLVVLLTRCLTWPATQHACCIPHPDRITKHARAKRIHKQALQNRSH